ncbi:WD repeat-containing protein 6 [Microdochium nivale]|nr:WD repeat-containing protein 6 [Microdochium nivale]
MQRWTSPSYTRLIDLPKAAMDFETPRADQWQANTQTQAQACLSLSLRREHVLNPITALAFYEPRDFATDVDANADNVPLGPGLDGPAAAAAAAGGDAEKLAPRAQGKTRGRKRYLLAAEDTDLKIYDVSGSRSCTGDGGASTAAGLDSDGDSAGGGENSSGGGGQQPQQRLLAHIPIFRGQSIHGISVRCGNSDDSEEEEKGDLILVWGGYSVAVLSGAALLRQRHHEPTVSEFRAPDWIFDAKISPRDRTRAVLLTAHNEVVELRIMTMTATAGPPAMALEMVSVRSPSRPILYAGTLLWLPDSGGSSGGRGEDKAGDSVLVAAGTVFGEVVVWKWHDAGRGAGMPPPRCEHLFAFSGHEGSIFGIQISPELLVVPASTVRQEKVRLLATCSDDRTVRIWDITERREQGDHAVLDGARGRQKHEAAIANIVPEARETGFGPNNSSNNNKNDKEVASNYVGAVGASTIPRQGSGDDDNLSARRCVAVAMGHISRIWHVEFVEPRYVENGARESARMVVPVYSFGEDATAQKWHLSFGSPSLSLARPQASGGPFKGKFNKKITVSTLGEAALTHKVIYRNHTGKHIWSRAILDSGVDEGVVIATGGSDGKITLVHDEDAVRGSPDQTQTQKSAWRDAYTLARLGDLSGLGLLENSMDAETAKELPGGRKLANEKLEDKRFLGKRLYPMPKKVKVPPESFQRYAFISEKKLLVVTNQGRCYVGTFGTGIEWKHLSLSEEIRLSLAGYCVVESSLQTSTVYIGTGHGDIYALTDAENATLRLVAAVDGKMADLFSLTDSTEHEDMNGNSLPAIRLLATVLGAHTATILSINNLPKGEESATVELEKGFVITAATLVEETLILGSRNGAIVMMSRDERTNSYATTHSLNAKLSDAITSILPLPQRSGSLSKYFLTTCRDGKYRIYQRQPTTAGPNTSGEAIALLHETSPPFGPLIERAWFTRDPSTKATELMLCGFRSTNAVLWNATQQREVAAVDCGGAHRSFALALLRRQSRLADGFRFVFTKASEMHVFSQARSLAQTVKSGAHGREIRAVSSSGRYTATAAEDTVIKIHEYTTESPLTGDYGLTQWASGRRAFRCVATMEKHATGIQAVRWHRNEYLFSSGGNEEFFVWRVNRIDSDVCPLGVACEAVFQDKSEVGDLRIMDFDVELLGNDEKTAGGHQQQQQEPRFCITMALSNSTVQSYIYSREGGFRLLGRRHYTGACLMQLRHLGFASSSSSLDGANHQHERQPHVLTAATDGRLAVFVGLQPDLAIEPRDLDEIANDSAPATCSSKHSKNQNPLITKLHQSGIKCLDMLKHDAPGSHGPSYLVVTGGDDNAIGMLHLSSSPAATGGAAEYTVRGKFVVRSAHAAAVTGIGIVRLERGGRDAVVVSTGNDQRVKTWRIVDWQQQQCGSAHSSPGPTGAAPTTQILLVADEYSGVADAGDLEIMRVDGSLDRDGSDGEGRFLVGGVGIEVWRV